MQTNFHNTPAGIFPTDARTNLFACASTKKVFFLKKGEVKSFKELPVSFKREILKRFLADPCARKELGNLGYNAGLEKFAKCMYGSLDHVADFCEDGILQEPDNYRCSNNCQCLFWKSKNITYNKKAFSVKQLQVIDLIAKGISDKCIADELSISIPTLSDYKKRIQDKLNTFCKTSTAVKAIKYKIVR